MKRLNIINLYRQFNKLKNLPRQGWLRFIPGKKSESVADHVFSLASLALFLLDTEFIHLDKLKVLKMILISEFGEIYAGDITPHDHISKEEKYKLERKAIEKVFSDYSNREGYIELWQEMEDEKTPEAKFVKQIDYLEMSLQAVVYEKQYQVKMDEFFEFTKKRLKNKKLLEIFEEIIKLR